MHRKPIAALLLSLMLSASPIGAMSAYAGTAAPTGVTMENCGAYLFTWRPVDCGNGQYFAIIAGSNTINEGDVILNRGYDYAYTFNPTFPRPWGEIPELVNIDGVWGIPENWSSLPEGSQPVTQIVLVTNNGNISSKERYVNVVRLPGGVSSSALPAEARKYLINADGSDAGAYVGTDTPGWTQENGQWMYRRPDGSFVSGSWLSVDEQQYYMDQNGIMLSDTVTPDGYYVNANGERTNYIPGWYQDGETWKYIRKNGYLVTNQWMQDTDGKWYYFNMLSAILSDTLTPDGYYVDSSGAWNGAPSSSASNEINLGPGVQPEADNSAAEE